MQNRVGGYLSIKHNNGHTASVLFYDHMTDTVTCKRHPSVSRHRSIAAVLIGVSHGGTGAAWDVRQSHDLIYSLTRLSNSRAGFRFSSRRFSAVGYRAACDGRHRLCYESVGACRNGKNREQVEVRRPQRSAGIYIL